MSKTLAIAHSARPEMLRSAECYAQRTNTLRNLADVAKGNVMQLPIGGAPIRILLADDHGVFRQALKGLLQGLQDVADVATCANGIESIEKAQSWQPDVVLMDVVMRGISGIDAAREIRRLPHPPRVIMLSGFGDEDLLIKALRAGASGYVLKECDTAELMMAISIVQRGGVYVSPQLSEDTDVACLIERSHQESPSSRVDTLTARELEILRLIADGYTGRGIAALLYVSTKTVEGHREKIMMKLDLHNKVLLTRFALSNGLIVLDEADYGERTIA